MPESAGVPVPESANRQAYTRLLFSVDTKKQRGDHSIARIAALCA
jgi:hypothetical protein